MTALRSALFFAAALTATATVTASATPNLEPATKKFVDGLAAAGGPPIYTLAPDAARKVLSDAQAVPVKKLPASIEDTTFPVGPTGTTRIRIIRPQGAKGVLPAVILTHGGGWILGDKDTHDRLAREIAVGANAAVFFVDYDRSPEAKYPVALEQSYGTLKHVAEHGAALRVDPKRMAIVGDSVGGNLAAAVTLLAKQRKGPRLVFQVLFYPVTDADFDTASYTDFANGPWLTRPAMEWFWNAYQPDLAARKQSTVAPLRASIEELAGLPDALVIVDENDVLRDEGEAYARKLAEAGVRVTSARYNGTIHDFVMLNALAETPATRAAIQQANDFLRAALHGK
jgi:acetyl esterase